MSNRILFTQKKDITAKDGIYDVIITEKTPICKFVNEIWAKIFWHGMQKTVKIRVRSNKLFKKHYKIFKYMLEELMGMKISDIWAFYRKDQNIIHPSEKELERFLAK